MEFVTMNETPIIPTRVIWLYGLSGAGKSTIANAAAEVLRASQQAVLVIDGDDLRGGLCRDLGFTVEDRMENVRRAAEIARLFCDQGFVVLSALMTPHEEMRRLARSVVGEKYFREVYVKCDLATCVRRDPKGLYARAVAGKIAHLPGKDFDFESPVKPDLLLDTENQKVESCVERPLQAFRSEASLVGVRKADKHSGKRASECSQPITS